MLLPDQAVGNGGMGPDDVAAGTDAGDEDSYPGMCRSFPDYRNSLFQSGIYFGNAVHVDFHHAL
jgi:hypothetical protein